MSEWNKIILKLVNELHNMGWVNALISGNSRTFSMQEKWEKCSVFYKYLSRGKLISEFNASLIHRVSSRTARTTQRKKPCLKKNKTLNRQTNKNKYEPTYSALHLFIFLNKTWNHEPSWLAWAEEQDWMLKVRVSAQSPFRQALGPRSLPLLITEPLFRTQAGLEGA